MSSEKLEQCRSKQASCRPTAFFVLGSDVTEVSDLLVPWEVLASSGEVDLFTVGTSRELMPFTGKVFGVADYVVGDAERSPPEKADEVVVVVPAVVPNEPELVGWVRKMAEDGAWVLCIGEGARLVADTGILDGGKATSHFCVLDELKEKHKGKITFMHGHRYVVFNKVISSAGVTAGLDAGLYLLEQMVGRGAAEQTSAALKYEWNEESDPMGVEEREKSFSISGKEAVNLVWRAAQPFNGKLKVGVGIYPGVSEVALAAVLDCLPKTGMVKLKTFCFSSELEAVDTRHGLNIIPKRTFEQVGGSLDLVIIPSVEDIDGGCIDQVKESMKDQLTVKEVEVVRTLGGDSVGKAFFAALDTAKELIGHAPAALAAKMVECNWDP